MPNLGAVLKEEISRLARKQVRSEVSVTRRAAVRHRRDIAALKRILDDLVRRIGFLETQERKRVSNPAAIGRTPADQKSRFSPRWLKAHRGKLGISAADYAALVGVAPLSIYNWERGKSKPRTRQLTMLASVRGLRRREAQQKLAMIAGRKAKR